MEFNCCNEDLKTIPFSRWEGKEDTCTILSLSSNRISTLPSQLVQFKNIELINAEHNQFYQIPTTLSRLPKLNTLKISHNSLSLLTLPRLVNLTHLDLSHNRINNISDGSFNNLTQLKTLDLSYNFIKVVSLKSVQNLDNLEIFLLNNNQLVDIPRGILTLKSLQIINVRDNHITKFSGPITLPPNTEIQADGNPIVKSYFSRILSKPNLVPISRRVSNFEDSLQQVNDKQPQKSPTSDSKSSNTHLHLHLQTQELRENYKRSKSFTPRTRSCSYTDDLQEEVDLFGEETVISPRITKKNSNGTLDIPPLNIQALGIEKDFKKLKKKTSGQKNKIEALTLLQNSLEICKQISESNNNEEILQIQKNIQSSISLLVSKKKRSKIHKRSSSLQDITKDIENRSSSKLTKETANGKTIDEKEEINTEDRPSFMPNPASVVRDRIAKNKSRRHSIMRRGNTMQECKITKVERDLELAFIIETVDGEDSKTLVGGKILSIFRYLMYHDRSMLKQNVVRLITMPTFFILQNS